MPRRDWVQTLRFRADQSGMLLAAANVPLTFQRTLMPRPTTDQAIVTGLSIASNHAFVSLVQESIQSVALVALRKTNRRVGHRRLGPHVGRARPRRRRCRHRPAARVPAAASGSRSPAPRCGPAGTGSPRPAPPAPSSAGCRRPSARSSARRRTRSRWSCPPRACSPPRSSCGAGTPSARTPTCPRTARRSLRSRRWGSASWSPRRRRRWASVSGSWPTASSQLAARVLPVSEEVVRPLGHAVALATLGSATRYLIEHVLGGIEHKETSVEAAFDIPPQNPYVSGSVASSVDFASLLEAGPALRVDGHGTREDPRGDGRGRRRPADPGLRRARLREHRGGARRARARRPRTDRRVRAVVAARRVADRHRLRELRGGDRARAPGARRLRDGGDAVRGAAVGPVARPGPRRPRPGPDAARRAAGPPRRRSRRTAARSSSCSARASARGRARTRSSTGARRASSTPGSTTRSGSAPRTSASGRSRCSTTAAPTSTTSTVRVFSHISEWHALDPEERAGIRYVMITHHDDGVALFGPELMIQAPPWLGQRRRPARRRCRRACAGCRAPRSSRCSST